MEHLVPEECRMQLAAVEDRKNRLKPEMGIPKELYLKEEDILLLTDS